MVKQSKGMLGRVCKRVAPQAAFAARYARRKGEKKDKHVCEADRASMIGSRREMATCIAKSPAAMPSPPSETTFRLRLDLFPPHWNGWDGTRMFAFVCSIPTCSCPM